MKQMAILVIIGFIFGIAVVFLDGPEKKSVIVTEAKVSPKRNIKKVVIDSCEYISWGHGLAHKGNCRFCAIRRRKDASDLDKQINK